jgi:hypothetical protein
VKREEKAKKISRHFDLAHFHFDVKLDLGVGDWLWIWGETGTYIFILMMETIYESDEL